MYVNRPFSLYKNNNSPNPITELPHEGPNSGFIVQDDEPMIPSCFGFSQSMPIMDLPLPSNKTLKFDGETENQVFAIPVINHPLSDNLYYLIKAHGKDKGKAYACSKEENKGVSCGRRYIQDEKPRPFDPKDVYQHFEIKYSTTITCSNNKGFSVKSIAPNGYPPKFLRTTSPIQIQRSTTSKDFVQLDKATGMNSALRAQLPDFNIPLTRESSTPMCIGRWVCPFMFIHEGKLKLDEQVKNSVYYEITLERRWERFFVHDGNHNQGNKVIIDVVIPTEVVTISGKNSFQDVYNGEESKDVWFRTIENMGEETSVGLSSLLVERMIWEEERVGWVNKNGKQMRVFREEESGGIGWWARFCCYVLVERFTLKRMDGSLVLTYDFMHTDQIQTKWE